MRTKDYLNSVQYIIILLFSFNVPADSAEGTNSRRPLCLWCWENRPPPHSNCSIIIITALFLTHRTQSCRRSGQRFFFFVYGQRDNNVNVMPANSIDSDGTVLFAIIVLYYYCIISFQFFSFSFSVARNTITHKL